MIEVKLNYQVEFFDTHYGLLSMDIATPEFSGTIKAFRRPEPQRQDEYITIKKQVNCKEFTGQHALIIGGSRGLGEITAKLLAAGGANVTITYCRGEDDASRVVNEIVSNGGHASYFQFDVLSPKIPDDNVNCFTPSHLYYFASPFIEPGITGDFSPELFNKFCDFYVVGFAKTLSLLQQYGLRGIFYPSTVFIDELPGNLGEYVVAKGAGEVLVNFLKATINKMRIYCPRLPKVSTDQTVSITPAENQEPTSAMIQELRAFRESPTKWH